MACSECCLWLVEFLIESEKVTDPRKYDEDDEEKEAGDKDPPYSRPEKPVDPRGPKDKPVDPRGANSGNVVPGIDTAALAKEEEIKVFKRERMKQLFNKHGYNLAIFPGGSILGNNNSLQKNP